MNDNDTDLPPYADPAVSFGIRVDMISQQIIDDIEGDDDHFTMIAGIIANLAAYLADTVEG